MAGRDDVFVICHWDKCSELAGINRQRRRIEFRLCLQVVARSYAAKGLDLKTGSGADGLLGRCASVGHSLARTLHEGQMYLCR